ncbi:hypothetical protein BDR05DRAFT_1000745 [Suillus weaverae]|nr:hypothetical protein BDR05DRAFT_1000745 [Suillus weaverae]
MPPVLPHLLEASIQFTPPQYPEGFLPPANHIIHEHLVSMYNISSTTSLTDGLATNLLHHLLPTTSAITQSTSSEGLDVQLASLQSYEVQSASLSGIFDFSNIEGWPLSSAVSASSNGDSTIPDDLDQQYNASTLLLVPGSSDLDVYLDLAWRDSTNLWGNLLNTNKKKINYKIPSTVWFQRMRLTKSLFLGSLWVRLHGNPFRISAIEMCRLITISFLTALHLDGKSYAQILKQPLTMRNGPSIRWPIMCTTMLQTFDNGKAELRKVVKASLTHLTNFCNESSDHRKETIIAFVKHFNEDIQELQNVLAELTGKQVFKELTWAALFIPIEELMSEHNSGRIVDLFIEEVHTLSGCLALDLICNLMTLLYQMMLILLVEFDGKTAVASFKTHVNMNGDIMHVLTAMYSNPMEFVAFTKTIKELPFITSVSSLRYFITH